MRFNVNHLKGFISDPLFAQYRLEKKLGVLSKKFSEAKIESEREILLSELDQLLREDISMLLSNEKIAESIERTGIDEIVRCLFKGVTRTRIILSEDSYVKKLRQAHRVIVFRNHYV